MRHHREYHDIHPCCVVECVPGDSGEHHREQDIRTRRCYIGSCRGTHKRTFGTETVQSARQRNIGTTSSTRTHKCRFLTCCIPELWSSRHCWCKAAPGYTAHTRCSLHMSNRMSCSWKGCNSGIQWRYIHELLANPMLVGTACHSRSETRR